MSLSIYGIDLAKHSFSIHGKDTNGNPLIHKSISRAKVLTFFANLPPAIIGMEACGSSHNKTMGVLFIYGLISNKQAAALIGIAPSIERMDAIKASESCRGTSTCTHRALHDYDVCDAGKPKKVAIIACVRKMVVILNAMIRDGVMWNKNIARN